MTKTLTGTKNQLHPRSKHRSRYDFAKLCEHLPELKKFIKKNKFNAEETIDFGDQEAVKKLNQALLKSSYGILSWDIPKDYLCPPIPGRADYIHYAADLLEMSVPGEKNIKVLDIGVGANCIYPLIAYQEYGWRVMGTDINKSSLEAAEKNIKNNHLSEVITLRHQKNPEHVFAGIILPEDRFDLTVCNPPFHESQEEAQKGSMRKNQNLGKNYSASKKLNFGGQAQELWCDGGEALFIKRMILESQAFKKQCLWFSTLVSKKENLSSIYGELKRLGVKDTKTFEMSQGQKISRFVAWTFMEAFEMKSWSENKEESCGLK